jgi:flagellar basal body-associated protein FliL
LSDDIAYIPEPPDVYESEPEKKNNTTLWIIIAVVAVILLCCCLMVVLVGALGFSAVESDQLLNHLLPYLSWV